MTTYKLEQKTLDRIAKIESMSRIDMKPFIAKMEECNDYEAIEIFQGLRRKDRIAYMKVAGTSYVGGSRINEINFNIAYEKYFGSA